MKKRIVTTTSVFEEGYPAEKAAERLCMLGFEGLDMALDYWYFPDSPFMKDGWREWAVSLREYAEKIGIPYTHSHAPLDSEGGSVISRSIETAGLLGAKYIVVHPICRQNGAIIEDAEQFIAVNANSVRPILETAEKCGVAILSENLLWGASKDPRIISSLVKEINSPFFGWCYDAGHANCFGYHPSVLCECACAPLSLHLQDNMGDGNDSHLIPGDGTVNWDALTDSLRLTGYSGDCVLEAHHQSLEAPDEKRDEILKRLLCAAHNLRDKMNQSAV